MSAATSNVAMSETAKASEARRETATANEMRRKIARAALITREIEESTSKKLIFAVHRDWWLLVNGQLSATSNLSFPQGFFLCMVNHI